MKTFISKASHNRMSMESYKDLLWCLRMKKKGTVIGLIHTYPDRQQWIDKEIPRRLADVGDFDTVGIYKEAVKRSIHKRCEIWL
jgi:hypothetical protein